MWFEKGSLKFKAEVFCFMAKEQWNLREGRISQGFEHADLFWPIEFMTIPEHEGKLSLGSCVILQSSFPLRQETGSFIKHISVPEVLYILFYLILTRPWFSVGAIPPALLMLGLEKLYHLHEIPAEEPGFKLRLWDQSSDPHAASKVPLLLFVQGEHTLPGNAKERGRWRSMEGRGKILKETPGTLSSLTQPPA